MSYTILSDRDSAPTHLTEQGEYLKERTRFEVCGYCENKIFKKWVQNNVLLCLAYRFIIANIVILVFVLVVLLKNIVIVC